LDTNEFELKFEAPYDNLEDVQTFIAEDFSAMISRSGVDAHYYITFFNYTDKTKYSKFDFGDDILDTSGNDQLPIFAFNKYTNDIWVHGYYYTFRRYKIEFNDDDFKIRKAGEWVDFQKALEETAIFQSPDYNAVVQIGDGELTTTTSTPFVTTYTATAPGYVVPTFYMGATAGTQNLKITVNGYTVNGIRTSTTYGEIVACVPVSTGDIVEITRATKENATTGFCRFYYMPPKLSKAPTPIINSTDQSYMLNQEIDTGTTWIDGKAIYKRTFSGVTASAINTSTTT
jgi:hypothetical protein